MFRMSPIFPFAVCALVLGGCASEPAPKERPAGPLRELAGAVLVRPVGLVFADIDSDGDAVLTSLEIEVGTAAQFAKFDRDSSAVWSFVEQGDWAETHLGDRYALPSAMQMDTDGNGTIVLDEFQAAIAAAARLADTDKDGAVSRSELLITLPTATARDLEQMRRRVEQERLAAARRG